jgi:hypothetical protein
MVKERKKFQNFVTNNPSVSNVNINDILIGFKLPYRLSLQFVLKGESQSL